MQLWIGSSIFAWRNMDFDETYKYKSEDVARLIAAVLNERRIMINITKIQKLLYVAYGTWLRVYRNRLLNEHPQAWPYGPVFPTSRNKLTKSQTELVDITRNDVPEELLNDAELIRTIDFVVLHFGQLSASQLSSWSHSPGSPWDLTVNRDGFNWGDQIPDSLIYDFFVKLIRPTNEQ